VTDTGWFFDTELLVLAERSGLRIHEVPVDWIDDPDSRVDIVATATEDLKGIARMRKNLALGRIPVDEVASELRARPVAPAPGFAHQLVHFGVIGALSTLAYLAIFSALHATTGAQAANFLALLITAIGNTAANRRFTFGIRGSAGRARHHGEGLLVFGMALLITSGSLASVHALVDPTPHWLELSVLVVANLTATVLRFLALRGWVFSSHR
jgi:putative flippase GtrA